MNTRANMTEALVQEEIAKMETVKIEEPKPRANMIAIKSEYLLKAEEKPDEEAAEKPKTDNNNENRKRYRGMDKKRKQKMHAARLEVNQNEIRMCPSVLVPNKKCKFGDTCRAEHSIDVFMKTKPNDIGEKCVIFDAVGSCGFGVACRYASAHTNEDYSQMTKDPDPNYKPTLNTGGIAVQIAIRKGNYDFTLADEACKKYGNKDSAPTGAMEREKLKLDMRSLKGKTYLAPLTTVGNLPFRRLCVDLGCEITCGEMAVATNFLKSGGNNEWPLLKRHPSEKIFGVQLAGGYPDTLSRTAQIIKDNMEVDFIDLNLGCPLDAINDKGAGCTLANRPAKLIQVVNAMQHVMGDIPLTLKMRYGMKNDNYTAHLTMKKLAEQCPPQLLTIHPRSREQRYSKEAHWDYIPQCLEALDKKVPLWVCGDVYNQREYYNRLETNPDIDGIMLGRGALIKPWIFTEINERRDWDISATERLDIVRKFTNFGLEHWGSDSGGVETTRRFLLEWMSFQHRYVPYGLLEFYPEKLNKMNEKPPPFVGRNELETLLSSKRASDWVKISEMFLGPSPEGSLFVPKHKANAW